MPPSGAAWQTLGDQAVMLFHRITRMKTFSFCPIE